MKRSLVLNISTVKTLTEAEGQTARGGTIVSRGYGSKGGQAGQSTKTL